MAGGVPGSILTPALPPAVVEPRPELDSAMTLNQQGVGLTARDPPKRQQPAMSGIVPPLAKMLMLLQLMEGGQLGLIPMNAQ